MNDGASTVRLAAATTRPVPLLRPELRYEVSLRPLELAASMVADASLVDTHYDLVEDGERRRIGAPWLVRPGGLLRWACG